MTNNNNNDESIRAVDYRIYVVLCSAKWQRLHYAGM
jgi:hypothetical protein